MKKSDIERIKKLDIPLLDLTPVIEDFFIEKSGLKDAYCAISDLDGTVCVYNNREKLLFDIEEYWHSF